MKLTAMKPHLLAEHLAHCSPWRGDDRAQFKRGARGRLAGADRIAFDDPADPWFDGWDAADRILEVDQA